MEVVRKIVDAKKLMSVIPLPETMRNRRVEVIVLPAEEQKVSENLKKSGNIESCRQKQKWLSLIRFRGSWEQT